MVKLAKSILTDFFGDVELVKKNINLIKNVTKGIGEIQQQVILATTNDKESELSAELKPLVEETNKKANIAKQMLQKLREDTERMKTKDGQIFCHFCKVSEEGEISKKAEIKQEDLSLIE